MHIACVTWIIRQSDAYFMYQSIKMFSYGFIQINNATFNTSVFEFFTIYIKSDFLSGWFKSFDGFSVDLKTFSSNQNLTVTKTHISVIILAHQ